MPRNPRLLPRYRRSMTTKRRYRVHEGISVWETMLSFAGVYWSIHLECQSWRFGVFTPWSESVAYPAFAHSARKSFLKAVIGHPVLASQASISDIMISCCALSWTQSPAEDIKPSVNITRKGFGYGWPPKRHCAERIWQPSSRSSIAIPTIVDTSCDSALYKLVSSRHFIGRFHYSKCTCILR